MRYFTLDKIKNKNKRLKNLEKDVSKLQDIIESLLEKLDMKVATSVYASEWNDYEVIKKEINKAQDLSIQSRNGCCDEPESARTN